jgi:glycosyltransferase involved in cell wall biosynthesis
MIDVKLVYRFKNPVYFSIENVFRLIRNELKGKVKFEETFAPSDKIGVTPLIKNILFFRKQSANIFHVTGDIHYAALAFPSDKVILTIHDCIFLQHTSRIKRLILKKLWLDWPVHHSTIVTTISEASKKEIISSSGCSPDKILVIPDPLDESFEFSPKPFNTVKPVILQVGTWPNKNLERVIDALKGITCHFLIVGKLSDEQQQLLKNSGIEFTNGFKLPQQDLLEWYRNSDIVMFATLFEGFGLPILEAQATGRPVITSNISPMKEVAGDGACLVDPFSYTSIRNAVLKICDDEAYREQIILSGRENIKKYTVSSISDRYLHLYQDLYARQSR